MIFVGKIFWVLAEFFLSAWTSPTLLANEGDMGQDLSQYLERTLKNFREQMPHGIPDLNIPPLDPFTVSDQHFIFNVTFVDIDLKLPHAKVTGLSSFTVERLNINIKQLLADFHMKFVEIQATGYYDVDGKVVKVFPVYGNGSFVLHSLHPSIALVLHLEVGAEEIKLRVKSLAIDWAELKLNLENFIGDKRVSSVLHRLVPVLAKRMITAFNPQLVDALGRALNKFLAEQVKKPYVQEMLQKILQQSAIG